MWVHVMVQQKGAEPGSEGWNHGKAKAQEEVAEEETMKD